MLLHAGPITTESLEHLPGFVTAQVRRVARTHDKTTWEYHHEHLPLQDFSPWLYLDELFWLYLRGSKWWLDYGGTNTPLVAAELEGRETDDTDVWLLVDIYYQAEGTVNTFRSVPSLLADASPALPDAPAPLAGRNEPYRPIDFGKLTVWRITFDRDEQGQLAMQPAGAPQTDPAMHAIVLPQSRLKLLHAQEAL